MSTPNGLAIVKERGILFSAPMVRALLDGSKTQTRRGLRDQDPVDLGAFMHGAHLSRRPVFDKVANGVVGHRLAMVPCPYGVPGDRLWVRETFFAFGCWETRFSAEKGRDEWHFVDMTLDTGRAYLFEAPEGWKRKQRAAGGATPSWWKRPAIFMPRAASRITLEVTGVRVERLHEISDADALAEGVEPFTGDAAGAAHALVNGSVHCDRYARLWESINGAGSWEANPWVWVIEFRRVAL